MKKIQSRKFFAQSKQGNSSQNNLIIAASCLSLLITSISYSQESNAALTQNTWVNIPVANDPLLQNLSIPANAPTQGMWSAAQPWPFIGLHSTVLPNGKVLTWGSNPDGSSQNGRYFDVWDPSIGLANSSSHQTTYDATRQDSFCAAAAFLPDGRLMVTGGNGSVTSSMYTTATGSVVKDAANLANGRR